MKTQCWLALGLLFLAGCQTPATQTSIVAPYFTGLLKMKTALALAANTKNFVIPEGGCSGGCMGGILYSTVDAESLKSENIPVSKSYDHLKMATIWTFEMEPQRIASTSVYGDPNYIVLSGKTGKPDTFYLLTVPASYTGERNQLRFENSP